MISIYGEKFCETFEIATPDLGNVHDNKPFSVAGAPERLVEARNS